MSTSLPERPNLDHLKKLAKSLLRAAQEGDQAALARFAILPPRRTLALHDAQSIVAREHGFPSWNALREEVEARTLDFDAAVDAFIRAAGDGAPGRAHRLMALHHGVARANFYAALVSGDVDTVRRHIDRNPALVTQPGGPLQWEPLLYACHTSLQRTDETVRDGVLAIARDLLARGANPNAEYHWNWHPELPRTALWAALCAVRHLPLARLLLEHGARPTDGVSAHIASGSGDIEALELLFEFGMHVDGLPAGVPPLAYMLGWSTAPAGARWLLDHGANPNLPWGSDNETPLHVAARRWDVAMVEALVTAGADVSARRADGATPHTLAALSGNDAIARWLLAHGGIDELTPLERFAAHCASGDREAARAMLHDAPALLTSLTPAHHRMLDRPAEAGHAAVLDVMLSCGFDPNVGDKDGVTPLHRAAMAGHPETVRVLIEHGANVNALDGMFAATPLVWAVEGRGHASPDADHVAVARVLIAAGSSTEWQVPEGAPGPERTIDGLADLCSEAMAVKQEK